jgi:hypothetical protein
MIVCSSAATACCYWLFLLLWQHKSPAMTCSHDIQHGAALVTYNMAQKLHHALQCIALFALTVEADAMSIAKLQV